MSVVSKRPLLFVDFLGFSKLVLNETTEEMLRRYHHTLANLKTHVLLWEKVGCDLRVEFVSDSVFIWLENATDAVAVATLLYLGAILLQNSIFEGSPIRGSLVFDEFIIDQRNFHVGYDTSNTPIFIWNHTILGKGIVKAASWEKCQDWIGISICPDDLPEFESRTPHVIDASLTSNLLIDYPPPTKIKSGRSLVLNPVNHISEHAEFLLGKLAALENQAGNAEKVLRKIDNSRTFIKWIEQENKASTEAWHSDWIARFTQPESMERA